jgi:methionyl aminopeptidase
MISVNDQAVHALPSTVPLRKGDLVKLDLTADRDGYYADSAITVALPDAGPKCLALRDCAKGALGQGLRAARSGRTTREIGRAVHKFVKAAGFQVIPSLCGHGTGRAIHEEPQVPNYDEPRMTSLLTRGLVLTIEPIICSGNGRVRTDPDGWTVRTTDGSQAAHFEHTVVITDDSPVVLTQIN